MSDNAPYFLAIDIGTSSVKACLVDKAGGEKAVHVEEYEIERTGPDRAEIDPKIYWEAVTTAIQGALGEAGAVAVAGVGVTSQGETLIALDEDGKPLRKAIVWTDNRAAEEARLIEEAFAIDEVYRVTGQQEIVPCWTAAKLLWLRRNEPEVFKAAAKFLLVADYIVYRLTGRYVSDHGLNPSTLYYDLSEGCWWKPMLEFLEITEDRLPELVFSGIPVGDVTADIGLGAGVPVVTAPIDQIAGALGAGNLAPGMVTETTGTAMAICATCDQPVLDPERRVGLYRHAMPGTYVLLPWVPAAGMIFRWFRDEFGGGKSFEALSGEAAAVPPGADGLILLPHLNGAFCPNLNPVARGVAHGLTLAHTRGHCVRAIFEAVAFMLRDNLEMLKSLGVETGSLCSLGGGAKSDTWMQIKADVLNAEIATLEADEVTGLGVAMLAAVGAGVYPNVREAAKNMARPGKMFKADAENAARYEAIFKGYRRLNAELLPTFGGAE